MNSWDPGWAHSLLTPTFSSLPSSGLDTLHGTSQHQQPSASGCQSVIWSSLFQSVSAQILCAVSNRPLGRDFPCSKTSIPLEKHHVHRCSGGVAVVGGLQGNLGARSRSKNLPGGARTLAAPALGAYGFRSCSSSCQQGTSHRGDCVMLVKLPYCTCMPKMCWQR